MSDEKLQQWEREQTEMKKQLQLRDKFTWTIKDDEDTSIGSGSEVEELKYVGGIDISFIKDNEKDACACFVVLSIPELKVVFKTLKMIELTEPYIPGFLAFRECPSLVELIQDSINNQKCPTPNVILVDGNGGS